MEGLKAFYEYSEGLKQIKEYLNAEGRKFHIEASINRETKNKGLIIIEAYYGLYEHINKLEAGLMQFTTEPQNAKDFFDCQVIPLKFFV